MTPVLLDTGVIVALLDRSERHHRACVEAVESSRALLVTWEAVIAESCYLMRHLAGAAEAIVLNVTSGVFQIPVQLSRRSAQIERILHKCRDREIDFADAYLIDLAGEFRTGDILTLDRDFLIYRWGARRPFNPLVPLE